MSGDNPERALGELAGADDPTRIGTYELLSRIGAGAMGEVYLAHDGKLQRRVSIKFLWPHVARDPLRLRGLNFRDMFVWLSRSMQSVAHSRPDEQVRLTPTGWAEL